MFNDIPNFTTYRNHNLIPILLMDVWRRFWLIYFDIITWNAAQHLEHLFKTTLILHDDAFSITVNLWKYFTNFFGNLMYFLSVMTTEVLIICIYHRCHWLCFSSDIFSHRPISWQSYTYFHKHLCIFQYLTIRLRRIETSLVIIS